jgi:hypothetical protein
VSPAFVVFAIVALALAGYLVSVEIARLRHRRLPRRRARRHAAVVDPGVERRAERRARSLLRSIVNAEEWEMYRDLGFIRVIGGGPRARAAVARRNNRAGVDPSVGAPTDGFCYLIYPHKPIVAYLPEANSLLSEYCVDFPDPGERLYGPRLPDSDDVLAKWMMIKADEEQLLRDANMHLPGRQVDPQQVRRDLWRLAEWERVRATRRPSPETLSATEPA